MQAQSFFKIGTSEEEVTTQQVVKFKKNIQKTEADIQQLMRFMEKNFESLCSMKKEHNELKIKHGENPSSKVQKRLLQLEVNIQYIQDGINEINLQERIQKLEETIKIKNIKLRCLTAQVNSDGVNERA